MLKIAVFTLGACLFSGAAFASSPNPTPSSKCNDAQDQATMTQCANDQWVSADKLLNHQFKLIEHRLADDPDTRKQFIAAQRAWIAFRDAECSFSTSAVTGGSIAPMMLADCKAQLTTDRNAQFQGYLSCPEGDLSCPVPAGDE